MSGSSPAAAGGPSTPALLRSTPALAATLCLVWALTFVVQRVGLGESGPLWFAAGRVAVAAVVLAPLLLLAPRLDSRGLRIAALLALLHMVLFVSLQVGGLATVGAGPAAAIIYTQPLLVLVFARIALAEPLTRRRVAGALLGFAGVAMVSGRELSLGSRTGALLLLAAALAWALGTVVTKAAPEQPALSLVVWQHLLGAPVMVTVAALAEPLPEPSGTLVATLLFAGALGSALAWFLFTVLLGRGDAGVVSTWLFSVPVLGAAFGVTLLGEPLGISLLVGIGLVAAGVRLASERR